MNAVRYIFLLGLVGLLTGCVTPADLSYIVPSEIVPADAVATPVYNSTPVYYTPPAPVHPAPVVIGHPGYDGPHHHHPAPPHAHGGRMEPARHAGPVRHAVRPGRGGPGGRPGGGRSAPNAAKRQAPGRAPSGRGGPGRGAPPKKGGARRRK